MKREKDATTLTHEKRMAEGKAALEAWAAKLPYRFQAGDRVRWKKHPTYSYIVESRSWSIRPRKSEPLKLYWADRRLMYFLRFDSSGGGITTRVDEDELEPAEESPSIPGGTIFQ